MRPFEAKLRRQPRACHMNAKSRRYAQPLLLVVALQQARRIFSELVALLSLGCWRYNKRIRLMNVLDDCFLLRCADVRKGNSMHVFLSRTVEKRHYCRAARHHFGARF